MAPNDTREPTSEAATRAASDAMDERPADSVAEAIPTSPYPPLSPAAAQTAVPASTAPPAATAVSSQGCVSNPGVRFTHHYTDLSQLDLINPTIATSGNWLKNRQYHKVVTDAANSAPEVPIYAPVAAVAVGVTHYLATMHPWNGAPFELSQFDIRFEASCEVAFWFDHLTTLAEPFASVAPVEGVRDTRDAQVPIRIAVEAGQLIGYSSGTIPAHTWDFVVTNSTHRNRFANQERYNRTPDLQHLLHADCPFDYYDSAMRGEYEQRFGWWGGRSDSAGCNLEVDEPGTLAGGWFRTAFDLNDPTPLADWGLVAKIEADGMVYLAGPSDEVRTAPSDPTFVSPATVSGEHCFQHYTKPARFAFVRVLPDARLAVVLDEGHCPATMPHGVDIFHR